MIIRFCLYSILKNLRFFDPFLAIYLLDAGFSYTEIGGMLGCQRLVTAILEIPSGVLADRWGRRRVLTSSFLLHTIALVVLAIASQSAEKPEVIWFFIGLCIFGGGEALREGCHKAMMLDYLEYHGQPERATSLLSVTRTFSKMSSALAGLFAGGLLFLFRDYSTLFWLSAAASAGGAVLIISYPKYLEGECQRQRTSTIDAAIAYESKLITLIRNARMWPMLLRSVIYESQVEIILQMFLQPFLRLGLGAAGISIISPSGVDSVRGTGALIVGANELFCDGLGAVGARNSAKLESKVGNRLRAIRWIVWATLLCTVLVGLCALRVESWFWPGLVIIGLITLLQNIRRPIYVSALNDVANKPLRATILSIDNQATALATAILMPVMGLAADRWGLWTICAFSAVILASGIACRHREHEAYDALSTSKA
ncbi:MAG TPA: MFS transporter [Lacipirellulaceae bacterium]|nr:MFS transporter [Lacipirellulaceae bacterium]